MPNRASVQLDQAAPVVVATAGAAVGQVIQVTGLAPLTMGLATPSGGPLTAALAADFTTSSVSFVNVTGLTLTLTAGRWQIMGVYDLDANAPTGLSITAINGPTLTSLVLLRVGINSVGGPLATAVVTAYDSNIDSGTNGNIERVRSYIVGSLIVSAGGTLALRLRGTTGEVARIKAGAWLTALALP